MISDVQIRIIYWYFCAAKVGKLPEAKCHTTPNYPNFWIHMLIFPKDELPILLSDLLGAEK